MNIINWLLVLVSLGTRVAVRLIAAWHRRRRPLAAQGQGLVEYALILVLGDFCISPQCDVKSPLSLFCVKQHDRTCCPIGSTLGGSAAR
jgi:hypothetical protein